MLGLQEEPDRPGGKFNQVATISLAFVVLSLTRDVDPPLVLSKRTNCAANPLLVSRGLFRRSRSGGRPSDVTDVSTVVIDGAREFEIRLAEMVDVFVRVQPLPMDVDSGSPCTAGSSTASTRLNFPMQYLHSFSLPLPIATRMISDVPGVACDDFRFDNRCGRIHFLVGAGSRASVLGSAKKSQEQEIPLSGAHTCMGRVCCCRTRPTFWW